MVTDLQRLFFCDTEGGKLPLDGLHVLVVDDYLESAVACQLLLERSGCRVTHATSVADAMKAFEQDIPNALLSDIDLPDADGYELIRRVRARPRKDGGAVPAAAVTGRVEPEHRNEATRAGFSMHIGKPERPDELVSIVISLVRMGV